LLGFTNAVFLEFELNLKEREREREKGRESRRVVVRDTTLGVRVQKTISMV
jgi:hypothetical protein